MPKDPNEIGALWFKEKNGKTYMTGKVNGEPVVVFQNTFKKEGSTQPDWRILKSNAKQSASQDEDVPF